MFIETYYDERAAIPGAKSEPVIPYPELSWVELKVWRNYLPIRTQIEKLPSWFIESIPSPVIVEIERAKQTLRLFDRIEIWRRRDDPMAVGIITGEAPRYFSIVRWGDALLTLEQVKKRLLAEKWLFWLIPAAAIFLVMCSGLIQVGSFVDGVRRSPQGTNLAEIWGAGPD